jgi:hypothetical protein
MVTQAPMSTSARVIRKKFKLRTCYLTHEFRLAFAALLRQVAVLEVLLLQFLVHIQLLQFVGCEIGFTKLASLEFGAVLRPFQHARHTPPQCSPRHPVLFKSAFILLRFVKKFHLMGKELLERRQPDGKRDERTSVLEHAGKGY